MVQPVVGLFWTRGRREEGAEEAERGGEGWREGSPAGRERGGVSGSGSYAGSKPLYPGHMAPILAAAARYLAGTDPISPIGLPVVYHSLAPD